MQPELLRASFDNFDVFAETVRGWDFDFIQLSTGRFDAEICQVLGRDLQLGYGRFHTRLEQRGAAPSGYKTFAVPMFEGMRLHWRNHDLDGTHLMAFPSGGELYSVSWQDFDVCTVSVRVNALASRSEVLELDGVLGQIERTEVYQPDSRLMTRLRAGLAEYRRVVESTGSIPVDHRVRETAIVDSLILALDSSNQARRRTKSLPRVAGLRRALELIEVRERDPLLVTDLVHAAGISQRSLEMAFRDRFGMGPKRYLLSRRLEGVRRRLLRSSPGERIADIAGEWGFTHASQFATDYRLWFGELPSRTVARRA